MFLINKDLRDYNQQMNLQFVYLQWRRIKETVLNIYDGVFLQKKSL